MVHVECLCAAGASALLLFGCEDSNGKGVLLSQHGTQLVTRKNGAENSTYQTIFAYDAKSGATVTVRFVDEVNSIAKINLWTGYANYFLQNSSPPICCRMPAPNAPIFPWVHQQAASSEPECNRPLLMASAYPACLDFALGQAQALEVAVDTTTNYHVQAGHGVNESWAEVKVMESIEMSPEGLLLSMERTRLANVSLIPVQKSSLNAIFIPLENESTVYKMQPGFHPGWEDLETWHNGPCGEPCFEHADFLSGSHSIHSASALDSQMAVVV